MAKKLEITSTLDSNFDVTTDFIFASGMFLVYFLEELYPSWIILLMVFVFSQFMLTNVYSKSTIYDPIGKYYGSLMYGGIGLMLSQEKLMLSIVTVGVTVSTIAVLLSRATFLLVQRKNP
jgi:phosphatidylglycerophosphate synthase